MRIKNSKKNKFIIKININLKLIFILFSYIFILFDNEIVINKNKNIIPIAFSSNNEYIYPLFCVNISFV